MVLSWSEQGIPAKYLDGLEGEGFLPKAESLCRFIRCVR